MTLLAHSFQLHPLLIIRYALRRSTTNQKSSSTKAEAGHSIVQHTHLNRTALLHQQGM